MPSLDIRFVTGNQLSSELIRLQAGVSMPFTPSHTEIRTKDGESYIGAQNAGIMVKPVGYDADTMLHEKIVEVPCTEDQETAFYDFAHSKIGLPYDWMAIEGFVDPALKVEHMKDHEICSAFVCMCLRNRVAPYLPWPMTKPFHKISPDMVMLILSSHVKIDH